MENLITPLNEAENKCLLVQLFQGLDYMHKNFIIHRDIKVIFYRRSLRSFKVNFNHLIRFNKIKISTKIFHRIIN